MRYGLALSGSGVLGLAHVGVLMALDEASMPPSAIAASGSAAVVAGLYACGLTPVDIARLADRVAKAPHYYFAPDIGCLLRAGALWLLRTPNLSPLCGWLNVRHLVELFQEVTGAPSLASLALPLAIDCVDVRRRQRVVLSSRAMPHGTRQPWHRHLPLQTALIASLAMPGAVAPIRHGPELLVSGEACAGVSTTLLDMVDPMLDCCAAVSVSAGNLPATAPLLDILFAAAVSEPHTREADLCYAILSGASPLDFESRVALFRAGYDTGKRLAADLHDHASFLACEPAVQAHPK